MPKNKKPAGGRPARDFDPRYGARKADAQRFGTSKPGSRSAGHRGYRPADEADAPKKRRWTAEERAAHGIAPARPRGGRSRDIVATRNVEGAPDRRERGPARSADRAATGRFERAVGPRDDRPLRRREDHDVSRSYRGERSERRAEDRPRRDSGDRPARRFGDDRPRRQSDDRPRRRADEDRAPRQPRGSDFYPSHDARSSFTPADDVVLERLEAEAIQASDVDGVTFGDLGLGGNIVRALAGLGADAPFPIQAATIPDVLAGRDVLGRGRTGSGKTIAFGAPLVERLMRLWSESGRASGRRTMGRSPRALIMAPTRELALQIDRTVQPIAQSVGLFTTQIYGGVPQGRQVGALRRGVDIVIGTPGRIEDLIEQGHLDLSEVAITVLDEADHMCDLGFLEPVQRILRLTGDGGQRLLFSATLDTGVASLVGEFLVDPAVHEVAGEDQASGTIDHRVFVIEHREKSAIVEQLADRDGKTLVFARTRAFAEQLADQLDDAGIPAVSLHGDLSQSRRQRNLDKLSNGRVSVLVATDVAARGIHVDDIDLVVQADAPDEYKTYLHRSGRTGRAGKPGTVVTLITRQRRRRMSELLGRAEIEAGFEEVAAGDARISDLMASA